MANNPASTSGSVPKSGSLLGLDYGSKRVGVAVCDASQMIASPLRVLQRDEATQHHLKLIAEEYAAVGLVVGLPVHMSGDEGQKAAQAREFGDAMAVALGLPVIYHDERFSSKQADSAMAAAGLSRDKRKARIDMLAAQFILKAFLDSDRKGRKPPSMNS